jgi:hypothetical protein
MSHPYPTKDCELKAIRRFWDEKVFADEILKPFDGDGKTIVIFELGEHKGYLYGQSNFKLNSSALYKWKFIRSFREVVEQRVLPKLKSEFGHELSHVLFLDEDLKSKFSEYPATKPFKPLFRLVKKSDDTGDFHIVTD